jgi:MFS transporter, PAT family, beta-lactamase induction signal transducer AmpG
MMASPSTTRPSGQGRAADLRGAPPMFGLWGQRKMAVLALLGFASGLPLYLTSQTLAAWLRVEGLDLTTIGIFGLVALPYSLKFIWAPLFDRYVPPFLGRRRGWLLVTQLALLVAIAAMSLHDPRRGLQILAINAICIAFFSASQDVVADAYRSDVLAEREMGAGAAVFVVGYRVALLATSGLAFILADRMPWPGVYLVMSLLMLVGIAAVVWAPEPALRGLPPQSFAEAVVLPFGEFFHRAGVRTAVLVLAFIVLYKLPDSLTLTLSVPFLIDLGFTQTDIGAIKGGLGIVATIVGAIAGGALVARFGINRSLWVFGVLQAISNFGYYALALTGKEYPLLVGVILIENFCMGMVSAGFVAFLMSMCSPRFSATQFALLSSLTGVGRDVIGSTGGAVAESTGWATFFLLTIIVAVPGLLLLPIFAPWNADGPLVAAPHTGDTVSSSVG